MTTVQQQVEPQKQPADKTVGVENPSQQVQDTQDSVGTDSSTGE